MEFWRCEVAAVGQSACKVNGCEHGNVVSDGIEAAGAHRTRCRRAPEERTVVAGVHGPPSMIREEFMRLVSLLCSEVLVAWSGALHVVLCYSGQ